MDDPSRLLQQLLLLGQLAVRLLGGPKGEAYVAMARSLLTFIDEARKILGAKGESEIEPLRAAIEERVNAHADRTIDSLGDGQPAGDRS